MDITLEGDRMCLTSKAVNPLCSATRLLYSKRCHKVESVRSVDPNIGLSTIVKMLKGVDLVVEPEVEKV